MRSIKIMKTNIYSRLLNRSKTPPRCKECGIEIKIGDEYVSNIGSHRATIRNQYAVYCVKHAKEKNLV